MLFHVGRVALFVALLTPLVFWPGVVYPWIVPRTLFFRFCVNIAFAAFILLLFARKQRDEHGRIDWFLLGLGGFITAAALSSLFGVAAYRSFFGDLERMWGIWGWLHFAGFYVLLRVFLDDQDWLWLFRTALLVAALVSVYAFFQHQPALAPFRVIDPSVRPHGTLGNAGYLAAFTLVGSGVAALLWIRSTRRADRALALGAGALMAYAFAVAQTRSAAIGLAAGLLTGVILTGLHGEGRRRWVPLAIVVMVLGAAGAALIWVRTQVVDGPTGLPILERFATAGNSGVVRLMIWNAGLEAFTARPLLGWGFENFNIAWDRFFPAAWYEIGTATRTDRAHNAYLEVLVTMGALGMVAFVGLWAGLAAMLRRALGERAMGRGEAAVIGAVVVAYLAYLFFWFEDTNSLLLLLTIAAYTGTRGSGPLIRFGGPQRSTVLRRTLAIASLAVIAAAAFQYNVRTWWSARGLHRAGALTEAGQGPSGLAALQDAFVHAPATRFHAVVTYAQLLESLQGEAAAAQAGTPRGRFYGEAIRFGLHALQDEIARDPQNAFLRLEHAAIQRVAYVVSREPAFLNAALDEIRAAVRLSPEQLRFQLVLADTHLLGGSVQAADSILDRLIHEHPDFAASYGLKARARLLTGQPEEAAALLLSELRRKSVPDRQSVVRAAEALVHRRDLLGATHLYAVYLEARYPAVIPPAIRASLPFDPHEAARRTAPLGPPARLAPADVVIAARLPVLYAHAGRPDAAAALTIRFLEQWAGSGAQAEAFIAALRAGTADEWPANATLLPPGSAAAPASSRDAGSPAP